MMRNLSAALLIVIIISCKSSGEKVITSEDGRETLEIKDDTASRIYDFKDRNAGETALEAYRKSDRRFEGKYMNVFDVGNGRSIAAILNLVKLSAQKIYDNIAKTEDTSAYRVDLFIFNSWGGNENDLERYSHSISLFSISGDSLRVNNRMSFSPNASISLNGDELTLRNPFVDWEKDIRPWVFRVNWKMKRVAGPYPPSKEHSPYLMKDDWLFTDPDFQKLLKENNFQL